MKLEELEQELKELKKRIDNIENSYIRELQDKSCMYN